MKKIIGKSIKYSKRTVIVFAVLMLNVILLLQLATIAGVYWLNSQNGQSFVRSQIETALKESGYRLEFGKFAYGFPHRLAIVDVELYDEDGRFASIDNVRLGTNILGLVTGHLGTSINGDTLTLYRLPTRAEPQETEEELPFSGLESFSLPDLYFNSFALDTLRIETLDIHEDVFGMELKLSPTLETHIDLNDNNIKISARLSPDIEQGPPNLPQIAKLEAQFNTQSLDFTLEQLEVEHDAYRLGASGEGNFGDNGEVSVQLKAKADELKDLTGQAGTAELEAELNGFITNPSLQAEGMVSMPLLKERGLSDIQLELESPAIKTQEGQFSMEATYQNLPITLSSSFGIRDQTLALTEIDGRAPKASVTGTVDVLLDTLQAEGELTLSVQDLSIYAGLFDIELAGQADADVRLIPREDSQSAEISLKTKQLVYQDYTVGNANIETTIPALQKPWPQLLNADIQNARVAQNLHISSLTATLSETSGDDAYAFEATVNGRAATDFRLSGSATLRGLKQAQPAAENMDFKLSSGGSTINIRGQADIQSVDVTASTQKFLLKSLPVSIPKPLEDLSLSGEMTVKGPPAQPVVVADLQTGNFSPYENISFSIDADARYENEMARVRFTGQGSGINTLNGEASLPLIFQLYPFMFELNSNSPLNGHAVFDLQTAELATLFLPPDHEFSGKISGNAELAGTLQAPDLSGRLQLENGQYLYEEYGVQLLDVQMSSTLAPDRLEIQSLSAHDEENGRLTGRGSIYFNAKENTHVSVNLNNFHLFDGDMVDGSLSANLSFEGQDEGYLLRGPITLGQFDIIIPERFQKTIPALNIVEKNEGDQESDFMQKVFLDMQVTANDRIFIRGWGLDAEFGGTLALEGTLDDPVLTGSFESRRGRYEEFGKRFTLEKSYLRFQGNSPPNPYLDIRATTQAEEISATVNISGDVDNPKLSLSSTPSLPEDEILSRILFGRDLQDITPFQAIKMKQTIDRFSGRGGGFDPLAKLRDLTGFDDIRVDTEDGSSSVGVGKYVTEDVYLELEQGNEEGSGAAKVQVEVTPNINVESRIGQDAETGAGVFWRWDY